MKMTPTFADLYIAKAKELMPHHSDALTDGIEADMNQDQIDDIVFHRGEYVGGMATVILELVKVDEPTIRKATVTDSLGNQYTLGTDGKRAWLSNQHGIPECLSNLTPIGNGFQEQHQTIIDAVLTAKDVAAALNGCTYYTSWKAA